MNKNTEKEILSFVISIFLAFLLVISCQSSNQETVQSATKSVTSTYDANAQNEQQQSNIDLSLATKIKVEKKSSNYFSSINSEVLSGIQIGSPLAIKNSVLKLKKADIDYSENELSLLNIASAIMEYVWPTEKPLEKIPNKTINKKYFEIIQSARNGFFEEREGKLDFFQLVLPCLVLTTSSQKSDYFGVAESYLNAALSIKPDSVLCNYLLGILYKKQNQFEKAITYFDKATEKNAIVYEIYFEKASCLVELERYDQVSNILDALIIQYPSDPKILKLYATTALLLKDYQKAEQYASLVLQQNPSDLEFVLFRAKIFVATGEYLKASSLLDVYSRSYPTNKECLLLRSIIQKNWNKNLDLSVSTIEKALSLYPDDLEIVLFAARLSVEMNQNVNGQSGEELANKVLQVSPNNIDALKVLSSALYNKEKYFDAYSISKKIVSLQNVLREDIFMHVKICLALKYNEEAFKYSSSLYTKYSSEPQVAQIYIDMLIKTKRTGAASKIINSLLNDMPSSSMKSFLYYERSFLQASDTSALADLRSSLISNPRNSDALFRMYEIYNKRKDYKKAQYYLKQVVSLNPNNQKYIKLNAELENIINQ